MPDPFQEFGISRQGPALFEIFGTPDTRGTFSPQLQYDIEDQRRREAAQKKLDLEFANLDREIQAENAADEYIRRNPEAAMAGSSRFGDISRTQYMQQRGPSYSDEVLQRSLANKLSPQAREKFYGYVQQGFGVNAAFDEAEADDEDMKARIDLVEAGLPMERLKEFEGQRIDPLTAASLRASLRKQPDTEGLDEINDLYDILNKQVESMKIAGAEPSPGSPGYDEYAKRVQELRDLNTRRADILRKRIAPAAPPPTGAPTPTAPPSPTAPVPTGTTAPAPEQAPSAEVVPTATPPTQSFMDTMKQFTAPKLEDILKVDEAEIVRDLNDPAADENTFTATISDPSTSLEIKKQALDKLKKFAANPPEATGLTVKGVMERNAKLRKSAEDAELEVKRAVMKKEREARMVPVAQKLNQAWGQEKSDMSKLVSDFAKNLGLPASAVEASLAQNELLPAEGEVDGNLYQRMSKGLRDFIGIRDIFSRPIRDVFSEYLSGKAGVKLDKEAARLTPFKDTEFAEDFGMTLPVPNIEPLPGLIPAVRPTIRKSKTYGDVLDAYLAEKTGPTTAPATQDSIAEVSTREEVEALPKGSKFRWLDGKVRIK